MSIATIVRSQPSVPIKLVVAMEWTANTLRQVSSNRTATAVWSGGSEEFMRLSISAQRVAELLTDSYETDQGEVGPTRASVDQAIRLLRHLASRLQNKLPEATAASDDAGGLWLYWRKPEKKVHVRVSEKLDGHLELYFREGEDYDLLDGVSSDDVAEKLRWYSAG